MAEGDVIFEEDLISKGEFATDDVMGIITPGRITFGTTSDRPEVTAALFAQEEIYVDSVETFIAGSVVTNHLNLNEKIELYYVPSLYEYIPPGMPGTLGATAKAWRKVPRSWVELN